jgi:hypothetical protein
MIKKMLAVLFLLVGMKAFAQYKSYDPFTKENQLKAAFLKYDMSAFVKGNVLYTHEEEAEEEISLKQLNSRLKHHADIPRNCKVRKCSEANNGYVQTLGIYNKEDDPVMYVRFTINPETQLLSEVSVTKN